MILNFFSATLNNIMEKDSNFYPLDENSKNKLLNLLPVGESTYLRLEDNKNIEDTEVKNINGSLVVTRGLNNTSTFRFPKGSCLYFTVSLPVVKWLICNYDCCDSTCNCVPVTYSGDVVPTAYVNYPWMATHVFSGSLPMSLAVSNDIPHWVTVERGANYIKLSGTPTGVGTFDYSVSATNCNGKYIISETEKIIVESKI